MAAARAALGDLAGRPVVLVLARRKDQHVLLRGLAALERPVVVACVGIEADPELQGIERTVPAHHRVVRSEVHTSQLQSRLHLVCRLLLEKKKKKSNPPSHAEPPTTANTTAARITHRGEKS